MSSLYLIHYNIGSFQYMELQRLGDRHYDHIAWLRDWQN